jgi:hypothetical protein
MTTDEFPEVTAIARDRRLEVAAWALLITQIVHGFTPAHTHAESLFGPIVGLALVAATVAAIVGIRRGHPWSRMLTGATGLVVAVGFVLYHAVPFESPVTHPYMGKPVGAPAWISVVLTVGAGCWAGYQGLGRARHERSSA